MRCTACNEDNPPGNRFCGACGKALAITCTACGHANPPGHRFCGGCGQPLEVSVPVQPPSGRPRRVSDYTPKHLAEKILQSRSALEGERKQVTVLFCDIKGSMTLAGQLDPEDWHRLLDRFFGILTDEVHRFEGTINQYTGDGIMALFGAPIAHEDHAQRACYAALRLQEVLRDYALELRKARGLDFAVRIGLNSGEVVVGRIGDDLRMDYTAQGHTVGLAQRLEQLCETGHVYLSEHTAQLVSGYFQLKDLGEFKVAGSAVPLRAYDLEAPTQARTRLQVSRARGLTRFVGRTDEMQVLRGALDRARTGHGQVVGVVGEPGLGKSRLCYEFAEQCRAEGIAVYQCHCPSYGKTIPFVPILELFRNFFEISERDTPEQARQKIAGALVLLDPSLQTILPTLFDFLGVSDPNQPPVPFDAETRQRQLFDMLYKVVRARSGRGLTSLTLVDDLHWVDDWSNQFVSQLVAASEHSHAMVLVNFRPEYQAAWAGRAHYQQLPIVPLGEAAVREMVASLLGDDVSVQALARRVMEWTGGNPLYAEEVINTLLETGQLDGERGAYRLTREVGALEVPATVQAIIAARIDRLGEVEKGVLRAASVVGKGFSRPVLDRVTGLSSTVMDAALERLKAGDFVYETALYPTLEYSFKHPLVHEVAYNTQLREQRARQHTAVAAALEVTEAQHLDEAAARLAYHWEHAEMPQAALRWHERAARVATVTDPNAAAAHWRKVRELVDRVPPSADAAASGARACAQTILMAWRLGDARRIEDTDAEARRTFAEGVEFAAQADALELKAELHGAYASFRGVGAGHARDYAHYGAEATRIAREAGNQELADTMVQFQIWGLITSGRPAKALQLARETVQRLPTSPTYGSNFTSYSTRWILATAVATAHALLGHWAEASSELDRFSALDDGVPDIVAVGNYLWSVIGRLYGDSARAHELVPQSLHIVETGCGSYGRAVTYLSLAARQLETGQYHEARGTARDALALSNREHVAGIHRGDMIGLLAAAELLCAEPRAARETAQAGIEYCIARELLWDVSPWLMLARASAALGDAETGMQALNDAGGHIQRAGARIFQPALHECRAGFARRFGGPWKAELELQTACDLYASLAATGHVERLRRTERLR